MLTKARRKTSWVTRKVITREYHWISFSVQELPSALAPLAISHIPYSETLRPHAARSTLFYVVQKGWHRKSSIRASTSSMNIEKIKIKRKKKWVPASIHQEVITELKGDNINPKVT